MKQLFNYAHVPSHMADLGSEDELRQFLKSLDLAGIELFLYENRAELLRYLSSMVGVHLRFWPCWLDFWLGNRREVLKSMSPQEICEHYGGRGTSEDWLTEIRENLRLAASVKPEYLIWHVSESSAEEVFQGRYRNSSKVVVREVANIFNEVADEVPESVQVLFENIWHPGLDLTDPWVVEDFFSRLNRKNIGIMMDTGHLMLTNPKIRYEQEGIDYVIERIEALGSLKSLIRGIHLTCSLEEGKEREKAEKVGDIATPMEVMKYISTLDQHRAFGNCRLKKLIELVEPKYLVHELNYREIEELRGLIKSQQKCLAY
jgi:Xylose isomerase-like TIM barrel.